jgi:predicted extracellular nuclease
MRRLMFLVSVLALSSGASFAQTSDLLITEYLEGTSNNKAVEIFNGTEDIINLGSYAIERYPNGSTSATSISLNSIDLNPGSAYVITHSSAEPALLALADQTSASLNFSGNDALVLVRTGSVVVDSFGRVGEDPGTGWSCSEGSTMNTIMRRLSSICHGDTVVDDAFDPCAEWSFFAQDLYSGLGEHIADCGAVATEANETWGSLKSLYR